MHCCCVCLQPGVNGLAAKPVPPPRDHLRIEQDGRLVNRAPAPQVPARTTAVAATPVGHNNNADPTKEQLESIRKFQVSTSRPGLRSCSCAIDNIILCHLYLVIINYAGLSSDIVSVPTCRVGTVVRPYCIQTTLNCWLKDWMVLVLFLLVFCSFKISVT